MRRIPLTKGRIATVDDCFYTKLVTMGSWHFDGRYAATTSPRPNPKKLYMHRVVAELAGLDISATIDHRRSHQTLNNQISNLRSATVAQNQHNRKKQRNNTSGYRGVTWHRTKRKWCAQIKIDGCHKNLGTFDDPIQAAHEYDKAVRKYHSPGFARVNFK